MPRARRLAAAGLSVLGGLGAGVLGSFAHAATAYGVPVGLLAGLALSLTVFAMAGLAMRSRGAAALAAAAWVLAVLLLSVQRPEGDLVVPGTLLGYGWVLGGMLAAGAAVSWPYGSTGTRPAGR